MSQARTTPTAAGAEEPHPQRWVILAVALMVGFMALLDVTIVNVALPSIQSGLEASASSVQWVVSGYALAFGLTLVAGGRLGDAHGRRAVLAGGLVGFVLASAAAGLAPNAAVIVAARLVQGAAAGLLAPQNAGLIQDLFSGRERGRAFGYLGMTVGIAAATGPVLGGVIITAFGAEQGWRYIFLVNVPVGLVAMLLAWRLVPPGARGASRRTHLDVGGALLLGAGVLCLLLPLVQVMSGPSPVLWVAFASPLLLWAFVRWERRLLAQGRVPLLDVRLLARLPGYASGLALITLYFTGFTGIFLVLSVFLQDGLGYSALHTGLLLTPFAAGSAVSAPLAGRVVGRLGRRTTVGALLLMLTGVSLVAVLVPTRLDGSLWPVLALPLVLAGVGGGAVVSPNFTLTLAEVPSRMGGAAGGALQTGQRVGSAMGAALLVTAYRLTLDASGDPAAGLGAGLRAALGCSLVLLACALVVAVGDLRREQARRHTS